MSKAAKKFTALVLGAGMVLGVQACSSFRDANTNVQESMEEMTVVLSDGREVMCIKVPHEYGFSCDWENAKVDH